MEPVWETASERSGVDSLSSAGGTTATEAPEEDAGGEEVVKVFVAVPEQHKNGKSTLAWALRHLAALASDGNAGAVVVVVAHVHAPAQMIPVMGSKFHASKLRPEQVSAYRQYERGKVNKHLDDYIRQCSKMKIKGKKLVIQNEDIAKGIAELVSKHDVSKLVMGAAADKHYSRKMMAPRSKTALAVIQQADPSCKIWFVCKEHLISTREAGAVRSQIPPLSLVSAHPNRHAGRNGVEGCIQRSLSEKLSPLLVPCRSAMRRTFSILSMEDISVGSWDSGRRGSLPSSCREEASSHSSSSFELPIDDVFAVHQNTAPCHDQAKISEDVSKQTREVDEAIAKANEDMKLLKQEMEAMRRNRDDAVEKLSEVKEEKEEMVAASRYLVDSQRVRLEQLEDERDTALERVEEIRSMVSGMNLALFSEFSRSELRQATRNFSDTMKIGEGGFGCVYKGVLRNTTVAIKMLHSESSQGKSQFQQELSVLSRVRHPNIVTLMGCCPEASGLVYEFLPNGSLEDRLACRNETPPLSWQARTRIIGEVCSALFFLHSGDLSPAIHGDLKPANILLDANLVSKLGDLGASRLPTMTNPGSTPYTDPEYLTTGELTARSDVYSLGIIMLRLVTGQPPLGIARKVEDALEKGEMETLVDRSAGEWPFEQAEKLMLLGLQCAEVSRRRRPERMSQVWRVVEPLAKAASVSLAAQSVASGESNPPFYFICPISQEVMRNPHTAADGFTYEAEAIKGWLDSGHDTSPMTKLALAHRHITPNYALRSAIEDYMKQHQHQGKLPPQSVRSGR
ncbi:hypothetical protein QYE76_012484 [Lolium multiflorum]|uniref:RING-type E3 ubiquitin transferase n=1 Tax=Lolium multiflorum TaxID=4521 RepID=A0AAD8U133_LOLMU|nr:hypothetical protein QYE76_012484 [Lolium multiflorum]